MADLSTPVSGGRPLRDGVVQWAVMASACAAVLIFVLVVSDVVLHGIDRLSWSFLTTEPRNAGRAGGIFPILVSTFMILLVAIGAAVPLALGTALFITEFLPGGGKVAALIGLSLDILAGVPSIVFGLFGLAFFCIWLDFGFSILSGGLTLACMALPILIRTTETGLRAVPDDWRHGMAALGMSRTTAIIHVLLPAAAPAVAAGLMLGIGRAAGETAALIFTSGYVDRLPSSFADSGRALAVHIYDLSMNVAGGDAQAHATALVLIGLILVLNGVALVLMHRLLTRRIVTA